MGWLTDKVPVERWLLIGFWLVWFCALLSFIFRVAAWLS